MRSKEIIETIARRYIAGEHTTALSREYGIDESIVWRYAKRRGAIKHIGKAGRLSDAQKTEIHIRYMSGEGSYTLAREFGVKDATIPSIVRARGGQIRSLPEANRKLPLNQTAFADDTPESHYWIGMLMADGSIIAKHSRISLTLKAEDHNHIVLFRQFLKSGHTIGFVKPKSARGFNGSGAYTLEISSPTLVRDLARYGVIPRKTLREKVQILTHNPDFWRGMVDGDGCLSWSRKHPSITLCGGAELMAQFAEFVVWTIGGRLPTIHKQGKLHKVIVSCARARALADILYTARYPALNRKAILAIQMVGCAHD